MPMRSWCMIALAFLPGVACLTPAAHAQRYRPDADGFPCARQVKLAIVATDQGFSIQQRTVPQDSTDVSPSPAVSLGETLKIDRALFDRSTAAPGAIDERR